ncbi:hypothetical protein B7494_g7264 [Chlorociboria aeruginascens]|nr:hypothetical protein B7494_g7264 [Chlorociboria aeruginascens]
MKYVVALLALAASAWAQLNSTSNSTVTIYTTEIVDSYTTYCPDATTISQGNVTYTATKGETVTITDCPCTRVKPVTSPSAYTILFTSCPPGSETPVPGRKSIGPESSSPYTKPFTVISSSTESHGQPTATIQPFTGAASANTAGLGALGALGAIIAMVLMYISTIAALALWSAVTSAQTTDDSSDILGLDDQDLTASIIKSDATATTYSLGCATQDDCGLPSTGLILTAGPSTIHFDYTTSDSADPTDSLSADVNVAETFDLDCHITSSDHGDCSLTVIATIGSSTITTSSTTTVVNSDLAALSSALAGATASGKPAASTTGSSVGSQSTSSSQSSSSSSAAGNSATTSHSTGAMPMVTANAQWIVAGAAGALALAAL